MMADRCRHSEAPGTYAVPHDCSIAVEVAEAVCVTVSLCVVFELPYELDCRTVVISLTKIIECVRGVPKNVPHLFYTKLAQFQT